jgi:hypothetical protein
MSDAVVCGQTFGLLGTFFTTQNLSSYGVALQHIYHITFNNGSLGSRIDEERSEMR